VCADFVYDNNAEFIIASVLHKHIIGQVEFAKYGQIPLKLVVAE